jgi:hypothetical protein
MKTLLMTAFLMTAPPTAASAMPVSQFLAKAEQLQAQGMTSIFSSDYKLLENEVLRSLFVLRDERLAAKAAGRPQAYCPPPSGPTLYNNEILAAMRAVPPDQRDRLEIKDALRPLLARKYPCR